MKSFNDTIDALGQQRGNLIKKDASDAKGDAPVWVQDSEVRACKICGMCTLQLVRVNFFLILEQLSNLPSQIVAITVANAVLLFVDNVLDQRKY